MTLGGAEPSVWSTLTGEGRLPAADTIAMGITKVLEGGVGRTSQHPQE